MKPRSILTTTLIALLALATTLAFAAGYRPDGDTSRSAEFSVTGSATNIDGRAKSFDVVEDGEFYTIVADHATVQENRGNLITVREINDGALVRVFGERLSSKTVLAKTVLILDDSRDNYGPHGYRPSERVDIDGYVARVQPRHNEIDMSTGSGNYVVSVTSSTVIRRYIYSTDISDIDEDDIITVTGTIDRDGKIIADRIQVASATEKRNKKAYNKKYSPRDDYDTYPGRGDVIEGTITYPAASFDRTFAMITKYGEKKVDVPKNAEVMVDREKAGVRDLKKGDHVRVFGSWDGSTMVATRVECGYLDAANYRDSDRNANRDYEEPRRTDDRADEYVPPVQVERRDGPLTGKIISIDYRKSLLTIDAGIKDTKIDASEAAITRRGSIRRLSDLHKGDKIEVRGALDGDVFKATMVDVVE